MLQLLLPYLSFACHKRGSAVLNRPSSVACSGAFLIYTQTSTDQKMHLCKMHFSIPNGASLCRDLPYAGGFSWVWSPGSCTLNSGICSDSNCNWFLKAAEKIHSVFDVKHSCISHKEGLFQRCEAFQSPAMHGSGKHSGWFVFERVTCSYGLYSVSDLLE